MTLSRIQIGRVPVDVVTLSEAIDAIDALIESGHGGTVFTPNVDHVVVAETSRRFSEAYAAVNLSLVDGMPVLWASKLLGTPLPEKISGSDLVLPLLERSRAKQHRVYFLGADPGVAELAKRKLEQAMPGVEIVGVASPRIDVDLDLSAIVTSVTETRPDIVLVALGAPKQEIFCHEYRKQLAPAVLVGVGVSLDFVAGVKRRAPRWVSAAGLEWLFRLVQEPRRLAYRYVVRDPKFLLILWKQWRSKSIS